MKDLVSRCPIEEVMQVISGRWPGLLIYYLKQGTKRFSDLRRDNPTISHRMLLWSFASWRTPASSRAVSSRDIRCAWNMI
jgi:hypothetical protein